MSPRGATTTTMKRARNLRNEKNAMRIAGHEGVQRNAVPSRDGVKNQQGAIVGKGRLVKGGVSDITPDDSGQTSDSGNDDDAHDNESDDDENEADEPDEIAPSETSRKRRGHQTGLSVSFSNATINGGVVTRKRAWSNRAQGEDVDMNPPAKTAKSEMEDVAVISDDEDNYDAVDLISESDNDERLEEEEERLIIRSEEEIEHGKRANGPKLASPESWEGFPDSGAPPVEDTFFSEHFARTDPYSSNELYPPEPKVNRENSSAQTPTATRRVRFADEVGGMSSSSSHESETDHDDFPDLFMQPSRANNSLHALFENDGASSDSEGSYWDLGYHDEEQLELEKIHRLGEDSSDDEGSSSGYETDEGESTDEEAITPVTVNRPQALLHLDSDAGHSRTKPTIPNTARRAPTATMSSARRQGPAVGSWVADPTKPIAIVDKTGKNMIFYPAQRPKNALTRPNTASSVNASPSRPSSTLTSSLYESENDRSDTSTQATMVQSPANLMMSGLLGNGVDLEQVFSSPVVGPPEAFYPFRTLDANGNIVDNDDEFDDDDEDVDINLNIDDFIDFGDGSDSEAELGSSADTATLDKPHGGPRHPTAFRRNQLRVQGLGSQIGKSPRPSAIKGGHLSQANEPISPIRRQKPHHRRSDSLVSLGGTIAKRRIETVTGK